MYIAECSDGSLYTGITTDVTRREYEHNHTKKAAKYTRSRRPVNMVYRRLCRSRREALFQERRIKKMTRAQKQELVNHLDEAIDKIEQEHYKEFQDNLHNFGYMLKIGIRILGLSQLEAAEKFDVSVPTIRRWCAGITEPAYYLQEQLRDRLVEEIDNVQQGNSQRSIED